MGRPGLAGAAGAGSPRRHRAAARRHDRDRRPRRQRHQADRHRGTRPSGCRLRSYVWADQALRLARLDAAIGLAEANPIHAGAGRRGAVSWGGNSQAEAPGAVRVLFHSIMWQYLPDATRQAITSTLFEAAETATRDTPIAWLRMEPLDTRQPARDAQPDAVAGRRNPPSGQMRLSRALDRMAGLKPHPLIRFGRAADDQAGLRLRTKPAKSASALCMRACSTARRGSLRSPAGFLPSKAISSSCRRVEIERHRPHDFAERGARDQRARRGVDQHRRLADGGIPRHQPVERILQAARHAMRIFRTGDDDAVGARDGVDQRALPAAACARLRRRG